jgi:hypothetical protein
MNLPGRLRSTTLGDVLGALYREKATGTLELRLDSGRNPRVHLALGLVVAVELDGAAPTLSDVLRAGKSVANEVLRLSVLRAMSSRRLHGEVLVRDFHVDEAVVRGALLLQLAAKLEQLELLPDACIRFHVTVRAPRGAVTDTPLSAGVFLRGKRRARDRAPTSASSSRAPVRGPEPRAVPCPARSLLGVSPDAGLPEIRSAYRRLARAYHPDLHPTASDDERRAMSDRFRAVTEAYRALVA